MPGDEPNNDQEWTVGLAKVLDPRGIADVQPIDGKVGPRLIDVTLLELIL